MIKFFRKIRYDLMEKNKTGKYFKYAIGEIILVVIGILIALQVNNWNNERLKSERNQELLIKLTKELKLNIDRAASLDSLSPGSGFKGRFLFTDSLTKIMQRGIEVSDLDFMVSRGIFWVNDFNLNTAVFEELKNTASLYAIGSDSLVTAINRYYKLCERESYYNLKYSDECIYLRQQCYDGWIDFKQMYRLQPKEAITNHPWLFNQRAPEYIHFKQYVLRIRGHSRLISGKLKRIIRESQQLITLIESEQ